MTGHTDDEMRFSAFKEFLLNFFYFGLAFAGFSSIIASFLNITTKLTLNSIFYILGVVVYCAVFSETLSCLVINGRLIRVRLVMKASFLAGAGLNPLYLSSIAMVVDAFLIGVEFHMRKKQLVCPSLVGQQCIHPMFLSIFLSDS